MRRVAKREISKRGCTYCSDFQKMRMEPEHTKRVWVCIHDECPYHELDPYDNYSQYLKSENPQRLKDLLVKMFDIERGLHFD